MLGNGLQAHQIDRLVIVIVCAQIQQLDAVFLFSFHALSAYKRAVLGVFFTKVLVKI